jgi:hypothetical protein
MEPRGIAGAPVEFDASLNRPLGMPEGVYHFAFEAGSEAELKAKRGELIGRRASRSRRSSTTSGPIDLLQGSHGLMLEYSYQSRSFNEDDGRMQPRFEISVTDASPILDFRDE